jgi:hypothetical protein
MLEFGCGQLNMQVLKFVLGTGECLCPIWDDEWDRPSSRETEAADGFDHQ